MRKSREAGQLHVCVWDARVGNSLSSPIIESDTETLQYGQGTLRLALSLPGMGEISPALLV